MVHCMLIGKSIGQYINILAWLSGQTSIFWQYGVSFILTESFGGIQRQRNSTNLQLCPESLVALLEFGYIEHGLLLPLNNKWFSIFWLQCIHLTFNEYGMSDIQNSGVFSVTSNFSVGNSQISFCSRP